MPADHGPGGHGRAPAADGDSGGGDEAARRIYLESAQRAAGVVAARSRGDLAGAEALMRDFPSEGARTMGFFVLAELSLQSLARANSEPVDATVRQLTLDLAAASIRP